MVGQVNLALASYKMLLYFSPNDAETSRIVQELEVQAYEQGTLVLRTDPNPESESIFAIRSVSQAISGDPGLQRARWIKRVEKLQGMLQRVERYKTRLVSKA